MSFVIHILAGAVTGVLTGFGIGGGTLLILYMITFTQFSQTTAQGINLIYFLPTAGASLYGHIKNKLIDMRAFWFAGCTGFAMTIASSNVAGRLDVNIVKRFFGAFLIVIGLMELFRKSKKVGTEEKSEKAGSGRQSPP